LTLWYSVVLAGIILVFGLAVYTFMDFSLIRQVNQNLDIVAAQIRNNSRLVVGGEIDQLWMPPLNGFGSSRVYAQGWTADGRTLIRSSVDYSEPFDPDGFDDHEIRRDVYINNVHLYVLTYPLHYEGQLVGYIQVAQPLDSVDIAINLLLFLLIGGGVAAVILAAAVGWLAAHRALRPLEAITQTALQITRADDLSRRIPTSETVHDEVGRLVQAFNESLERLERLFNAQRRFLADVSHELRTPLTVIRGNVDLLRRMGGADPTSLDAIQSEAERMSRLVGDLLLLAQAEAGTLPMARNPVELDTLLLEVFHESQVLAGGVSLAIGDIDQALVIGDRDRLKQLLLNLVSNALKYTPEGGRVTLALTRVKDWARLVVTDTGIGIPPGELPHIFDRFYRVDKARTRAQGGAGLGLAIAQRIAQVHGGRLEAASDGASVPAGPRGQAGRGSTFSLWLPLAADKAPVEAPRKLLEHKTAPALSAAKKAGG
jgi:signal transduction histidine kinase